MVLPSSRDAPEWSVSKGRPRSSPSPLAAAAAEERGAGRRSARRRGAWAADCKGKKHKLLDETSQCLKKKQSVSKNVFQYLLAAAAALLVLAAPPNHPAAASSEAAAVAAEAAFPDPLPAASASWTSSSSCCSSCYPSRWSAKWKRGRP